MNSTLLGFVLGLSIFFIIDVFVVYPSNHQDEYQASAHNKKQRLKFYGVAIIESGVCVILCLLLFCVPFW